MTETKLPHMPLDEFEKKLADHQTWLKTSHSRYQATLQDVDLTETLREFTRKYAEPSGQTPIVNLSYSVLKNVRLKAESSPILLLSSSFLRDVNFDDSYFTSEASFAGTRLEHCSFINATASGVNFNRTSWSDCNLVKARFITSSFISATFNRTDVTRANFDEANISSAVWTDGKGPYTGPIARLDFGHWSVVITTTDTTIGCQHHPNEFWLKATASMKAIKKMHPQASNWWRLYGAAVKAAIKAVQTRNQEQGDEYNGTKNGTGGVSGDSTASQ